MRNDEVSKPSTSLGLERRVCPSGKGLEVGLSPGPRAKQAHKIITVWVEVDVLVKANSRVDPVEGEKLIDKIAVPILKSRICRYAYIFGQLP